MQKPTARHLQKGFKAEQLACDYLCKQGLTLIDRNYRSAHGEIDLIMQQRETLVFIEVRYRRSEQYGTPAETVGHKKQAKLRACAQHFLQRHAQADDKPCRFDIIAINGPIDDSNLTWLQNAL